MAEDKLVSFTVAAGPAHYKPDLGLLSLLQPFEISQEDLILLLPSMRFSNARNYDTKRWGFATGTLEQSRGLIKVMAHEHIADTLDGGFSDMLQTVDGSHVPCRLYGLSGEADADAPLLWKSPTLESPSAC